MRPVPIWRILEMQTLIRAFSRAWAKTGKRIAARMEIMAITTRSSIRVKADFRIRGIADLLFPHRVANRKGPKRARKGENAKRKGNGRPFRQAPSSEPAAARCLAP